MTTPTPDALTAAIDADKPVIGTLNFEGETFDIYKKVSTLHLLEIQRLARLENDEAMDRLIAVLERSLGKEQYQHFSDVFADVEFPSVGDAIQRLFEVVADVTTATTGRPTQ